MVFVAHVYDLNQAPTLFYAVKFVSSSLAIKCFFILSGYLITASFYNNDFQLKKFYTHRFARIYPAYFVVVCASFLSLSLLADGGIGLYFKTFTNWKYVFANLAFLNFLQPTLAGVFVHNPMLAINGALWTIKIEVLFYLLLPFLVKFIHPFSVKNKLIFLGALYGASVLYTYVFTSLFIHPTLAKQFPGMVSLFCVGIASYYVSNQLKQYGKWLLVPALLAYGVESWLGNVDIVRPFAMAIVMMVVAFNVKKWHGFGKYGDFSYGIYLIHFPVIQVLISLGYFQEAPWLTTTIAFVMVWLLGMVSWYVVEKPCLMYFKHRLKAKV
jgi:peptidoglycan/LPS O-acetylase OafA/YrhL